MAADLKTLKVLVTPTSYGKTDARLFTVLEKSVGQVVYNPSNRPLTSAEVRELLPGCDGFIAGLDVIDRAALEAADRLKVIARYGVGVRYAQAYLESFYAGFGFAREGAPYSEDGIAHVLMWRLP